jgi:hypothetical protein
MIAALLLAQAAAEPGTLPPQALPARGCAAYLWSVAEPHRLVALAGADPARLRLALGGTATDLPRTEADGAAAFGLAATTRYRAGDVSATLELTTRTTPDLTGGALVPAATLTVERAGADAVVMPVGGLVGCAPASPGR